MLNADDGFTWAPGQAIKVNLIPYIYFIRVVAVTSVAWKGLVVYWLSAGWYNNPKEAAESVCSDV